MKKFFAITFLIFPITAFTQQNEISAEVIEAVCQGSKADAVFSLATLSANTNSFNNVNLENIRSTFIELMELERAEIKSIVNTKTYDIILNSKTQNFKYALCEKFKRPSAISSTIASESYFLCRKTFDTNKEQKPEPCF